MLILKINKLFWIKNNLVPGALVYHVDMLNLELFSYFNSFEG